MMGIPVVLVHGIWMTGLEMLPLARRLRGCGFVPRRFPYADLRRSPAQNAQLLQVWLAGVAGEEVHFVAHSLGGILLLHLFDRYPGQRPGRAVFLGTPAAGSVVAKRLHRIPGVSGILGKSGERGLLGGAPGWAGDTELGLVVGTRGPGVGQLVTRLERPHDGTVMAAETRLPGATDRVAVPTSHTGLLFSAEAARLVCAFLHTGRFPLPGRSGLDPGGPVPRSAGR
jgi:pimeloyl-ACP methyl ester carboxylesterase